MNLENVEDVYRLSPMQEGMLLHSISHPQSGVFVQQICHELIGEVEISSLQDTWQDIMQMFDVLRTVFLWDGLDEPLQVVRQQVEQKWSGLDWTGYTSEQHQEELSSLLANDRRTGFDLAKAPVGRHILIQLNPSHWWWIWSYHHIQLDGWSTSIVLQEFLARCAASTGTTTQTRKPQHREFVQWLGQQDIDSAEKHWRTHLAGFVEPSRLNSLDEVDDVSSSRHQQTEFLITSDDSNKARSFARENRITLNALVQGAWALLFSRYSGEQDIVYGSTVGGRPPQIEGIEQSVGLFINTLPVRVNAAPNTNLTTWLTDLHNQLINLQQWEFSPLAKVQTWSDIEPGQPLFEYIFVFENYPNSAEDTASAGFKVVTKEHYEQSNYPFAILVVPGEQIRLIVVHDSNRFSPCTVELILRQLNFLIQSFVKNPNRPISDIALSESEIHWKTQKGAASVSKISGVHQLFEHHVQTIPDASALISGNKSYSYRETDALAKCIRAQLTDLGIRANDRVGICLNRSTSLIVAVLGVLKAGAAYVPLDPEYPLAQLDFIAADANLGIVLTDSGTLVELSDSNIQTINLDIQLGNTVIEDETERDVEVSSSALAYVIYTSGSSGQAKGVPISHANIVSSTKAREEYYGAGAKRFLLLSSFSFDSSCASIFGALCTGGTLVLPEPGAERNMAEIERLIDTQKVTNLLCLPGLYSLILEHSNPERLRSLQTVVMAGEGFPGALCRDHFEHLPRTRLFNEYGPTEGTVWSTVYEVSPDDQGHSIPIGKPIGEVEILIEDSHGQPAPPGVPGELLIGGPGTADGYFNRPDLTAASFVQRIDSHDRSLRMYKTGDLVADRGDGNLVFLGRIDDQVKIRGYRIEPSAIEDTLRSHPAVKEVVVVPVTTETNDSLLQRMKALPVELAEQLLDEVEGVLPEELAEIRGLD